MSTQVKDVAVVTISKESARLVAAGFGIAVLVTDNNRTDQRATVFTDPVDMLSQGYLETDEVYKMAVKLMSQTKSSEEFIVGRKKGDSNCLQTIIFDKAATSGTFTLTLGEETTATIDFDATNLEIKAALESLTAITEVTVTGDATDAEFTVEFTGADINTDFAILEVDAALLVGPIVSTVEKNQFGSEAETITEALTAIYEENNSFWAINTEFKTQADVLAIAAWAELREKFYVPSLSDADILTNVDTDTVSLLVAQDYDYIAAFYSADAANYPECAWCGGQLPEDAGSITWKFKELKGIAPDVLTSNQIANLKAKNCNYFESLGGVNVITSEATVVSGEYIDIIRGLAWLQARCSEALFAGLIARGKVPMNNAGISYMADKLRPVLNEAVSVQLINPGYTITQPDESELSATDKEDRILRGISFDAILSGAIHKVYVDGKVSY